MSAMHYLVYADTTDTSPSNIFLLLVGALIVGAIAIAAFIIVALAGRRHHRSYSILMTASIFWAALTLASALNTLVTQIKWTNEQALRVQSGYYGSAQAAADAPKFPWTAWAILAAIYFALFIWAVSAPRPRPVEPLD
jgi:cytochrome bd-type quinol oxidase subunit 2